MLLQRCAVPELGFGASVRLGQPVQPPLAFIAVGCMLLQRSSVRELGFGVPVLFQSVMILSASVAMRNVFFQFCQIFELSFGAGVAGLFRGGLRSRLRGRLRGRFRGRFRSRFRSGFRGRLRSGLRSG